MKRQEDFVRKYWAYAKALENVEGFSAIAVLAQCAVETGWGRSIVGNMMFGVKDTDGVNGNEQLLVTTEYLNRPTAKFPAILRITQVSKNLWKYVVRDYFRKYNTPYDSFLDYAKFIKVNRRYNKAMEVRGNYAAYLKEVAEAGYATAKNYYETCLAVAQQIEKVAIRLNLL
jgi:flagellum-specific peptidoglycan hydrolase FlgJ